MCKIKYLLRILSFLVFLTICTTDSNKLEYCEKPDEFTSKDESCVRHRNLSRKRYLLYDVNPSEGFNLRRDVYIRIAVFIKNLANQDTEFDWHLVLPPWGDLYHWQSADVGSQKQISWNVFFDVTSLQKYAPVLEMYEFLKEYPSKNKETVLDSVYILQNDEEMFKTGKFEDKNQLIDCPQDRSLYKSLSAERFSGRFWGYSNVTAHKVKCVVFHGMTSGLQKNLHPTLDSSVMFDHMEIALHDTYGSREYWQARRSMRYNLELYEIANNFRKKYLQSDDESDKTERPYDWTAEKSKRTAVGGPYLAVHLRRRDFVTGRAQSVPTIKNAASQLRKKMEELGLKVAFVATDTEDYEYYELKKYLAEYEIFRFVPSDYIRQKFKDGGIAIIDQIICSYARYFIGTHESTFTFRIQEDREILGFQPHTTFNRLCGKEKKCSPGGQWEIIW